MGLKKYTRSADYGNDFAAKIFKISRDHQGNRLTYLKITGGSLKVKTLLTGKTKEHEVWQEKVNQIRIYSGEKFQTTEEAFPGKIYAVTGLTKAYQGEGLGEEPDSEIPILESALTYRVLLPPEIHAHTALSKLRLLEEEEPALHVVWREPLQEIHVQLMGEVQLEVLKRIIWERFQIDVEFSQGTIIYKETIADTVEGVGHFEPLRHYAEVHLLLEPGERGSGLSFHSTCSEDDLDKNWQHLVLSHLQEKRHVGVLTGSPLTDLKITLIGGRAHEKHTEGGDFREATLRAVRQGLKQAKSVLLEPSYDFRLEVPSEMVGRSMSDIQRMNGNFETPQVFGDNSVLTGSVPLATMWDYQREVTNYTRGKGRLS
ncbi:MAG: translation elongation factor G, partial [Anaerovorax sp.]